MVAMSLELEVILAAHQALLRGRLHTCLSTLHPLLRADVVFALQQPGKLLYSVEQAQATSSSYPPAGSWALLTFLSALCVQPTLSLEAVSSVAVALECFICALDLLDDVEDEEQTALLQVLGVPRTVNVATALLACSQQLLLAVEHAGIEPARVLTLQGLFQTALLRATGGQHRDLLAEQRSVTELTLEECIEIATEKAGSLMALACLAGAVLAQADEQSQSLFAELGTLLGIAHQLDNDSHDLYAILQASAVYGPSGILKREGQEGSFAPSGKTDLRRGKKTLPVVLAARELKEPVPALERSALQQGIVATWGISLLYRERAGECLHKIDALHPVPPLLRSLLRLS